MVPWIENRKIAGLTPVSGFETRENAVEGALSKSG
jgi:hypothetical protein